MDDKMKHKGEEFKGRAKSAAGEAADDPELKRKGKADQLKGKAKQTADDVAEKARELKDRARGR